MMYLKKAGLLACMWMFFSTVKAQDTIRLSDNWEFLKSDLGGVWEAVRPAKPGSPESVPLWQNVSLPHCYNAFDAVSPEPNYYQGPAWYRSNIQVENPYQNGRTLLHFEGAGQKTEVYLFTEKVGEHVGGYDEWTVDITDALKRFRESRQAENFDGKIPLSIRCDNSRDLQMIPSDMSDFTVYGGIYRHLNLVYVPQLSLKTFHVNTSVDEKGKTGELQIDASFLNSSGVDNAKLELAIYSPSGEIVERHSQQLPITVNGQEIFRFSLKKPTLWSPETPKLYTVIAKLSAASGTQQTAVKFGFRNFRFALHGPFYLNGERLLLRGTHRHQDWAGVGAAETDEMVRREMIMMKEMGVNFIRLGHYQQSSLVLELCDSLGFLVWEEIPWCRGGLGGEVYQEQARRMLRNMISQHRNHPSVILWGLGNENDWPGDFQEFDKQKIRAFMSELNDLAHQLDPSRKTTIRRCDFCKDIVDVYSPSIWAGWYSGRYTEYKASSEKQMKRVNHFFHAEWGADAHARRHAEKPYKNLGGVPTGQGTAEEQGDAALTGGNARASRDGDWSETYQCDVIDWHLKEQETMPWLTGAAQWIFKDFATPLRPNNPVPYVNSKGIVTRDLRPKEGYYVFQSYWTEKPMAHIYGHTWPVRWGDEGEQKTIKVYSNCSQAELFVNGKSMGVKKRNSQNFPAAGLRWDIPMHEGKYHLKVLAEKDDVQIVDSISFLYQTEKWKAPTKLVLEKITELGDTTTVRVKAVDENGVWCLDADQFVYFSIAGDGELIADLGTSDGSRKVQMYNGRAIIRIKNNKGKNVVAVKAENMETALLHL